MLRTTALLVWRADTNIVSIIAHADNRKIVSIIVHHADNRTIVSILVQHADNRKIVSSIANEYICLHPCSSLIYKPDDVASLVCLLVCLSGRKHHDCQRGSVHAPQRHSNQST